MKALETAAAREGQRRQHHGGNVREGQERGLAQSLTRCLVAACRVGARRPPADGGEKRRGGGAGVGVMTTLLSMENGFLYPALSHEATCFLSRFDASPREVIRVVGPLASALLLQPECESDWVDTSVRCVPLKEGKSLVRVGHLPSVQRDVTTPRFDRMFGGHLREKSPIKAQNQEDCGWTSSRGASKAAEDRAPPTHDILCGPVRPQNAEGDWQGSACGSSLCSGIQSMTPFPHAAAVQGDRGHLRVAGKLWYQPCTRQVGRGQPSRSLNTSRIGRCR